MPGKRILLIDDDRALLWLLEQAFVKKGYQVYTADDGGEGLRQLFDHRPDVVILDIMMPTMDGWETYRRMRQLSNVPVIVFTGLGGEEDSIHSLKAGAGDHPVKPFKIDILLAMVEAMLRRAAFLASPNASLGYCDDHLVVDLAAREVFVRGQPVRLSPKEYELLVYLVQRAGQVLPHSQILRDVWDLEGQEHIRNVHLYIGRLRQRLEVDSRQPRYILTVYGIGYRFKKYHSDEAS
jgi:two-component system KDP operon response regulator KdpE